MPTNKVSVLALLLLCFSIGVGIQLFNHEQTSRFIGLWSGTTTIFYQNDPVDAHIQLIVQDDGGRVILNYQPQSPKYSGENHQISVRVNILDIEGHSLKLSVTDLKYNDRDALEKFLGRDLPVEGYLMNSFVWPISESKLFLQATLGFGEEFGLYLNRHE
ncbi:hypothetical protein L4D20_13940 [Vibrio kyushuensis]|uniref:hypothetical protein n=1 Tax=Vibrio kyushuensis TaxID=2910249 RepID=UPI003D0C18BD